MMTSDEIQALEGNIENFFNTYQDDVVALAITRGKVERMLLARLVQDIEQNLDYRGYIEYPRSLLIDTAKPSERVDIILYSKNENEEKAIFESKMNYIAPHYLPTKSKLKQSIQKETKGKLKQSIQKEIKYDIKRLREISIDKIIKYFLLMLAHYAYIQADDIPRRFAYVKDFQAKAREFANQKQMQESSIEATTSFFKDIENTENTELRRVIRPNTAIGKWKNMPIQITAFLVRIL